MTDPRHALLTPFALPLAFALASAGCAAGGSKAGGPAPEAAAQAASPPAGEAAPASPTPALAEAAKRAEEREGPADDEGDLDRAEREIEALFGGVSAPRSTALAGDECATACRALSSMHRAASRLCALDLGGDAARCESARARVERARARVRASCPACEPPG